MKVPQNPPYQRSRHRAALQAWVVAATAVASIGMPAAAVALPSDTDRQQAVTQQDAVTPAQAAQRAASDWLAALRRGDVGAAWRAMRLPRGADNERHAMDEANALADWLHEAGHTPEPVASRQAGHWAVSVWRLGGAALIEPITLYHPASDGLAGDPGDWQVVPQGMADDPALAPLYNADHAELMRWYAAL